MKGIEFLFLKNIQPADNTMWSYSCQLLIHMISDNVLIEVHDLKIFINCIAEDLKSTKISNRMSIFTLKMLISSIQSGNSREIQFLKKVNYILQKVPNLMNIGFQYAESK